MSNILSQLLIKYLNECISHYVWRVYFIIVKRFFGQMKVASDNLETGTCLTNSGSLCDVLLLLLFHFLLCPFILSMLFSMTTARGVTYLFDIQVKTFNHVFDGEDVIAQARTGTGKTFSFAVPLIEKLQSQSGIAVRGRAPKVHTQHPRVDTS